jgi:hypothetical protein
MRHPRRQPSSPPAQLARFARDVDLTELKLMEFDHTRPWPDFGHALWRSYLRPETVQILIHAEHSTMGACACVRGWTKRKLYTDLEDGTWVPQVAPGDSGPRPKRQAGIVRSCKVPDLPDNLRRVDADGEEVPPEGDETSPECMYYAPGGSGR